MENGFGNQSAKSSTISSAMTLLSASTESMLTLLLLSKLKWRPAFSGFDSESGPPPA